MHTHIIHLYILICPNIPCRIHLMDHRVAINYGHNCNQWDICGPCWMKTKQKVVPLQRQ